MLSNHFYKMSDIGNTTIYIRFGDEIQTVVATYENGSKCSSAQIEFGEEKRLLNACTIGFDSNGVLIKNGDFENLTIISPDFSVNIASISLKHLTIEGNANIVGYTEAKEVNITGDLIVSESFLAQTLTVNNSLTNNSSIRMSGKSIIKAHSLINNGYITGDHLLINANSVSNEKSGGIETSQGTIEVDDTFTNLGILFLDSFDVCNSNQYQLNFKYGGNPSKFIQKGKFVANSTFCSTNIYSYGVTEIHNLKLNRCDQLEIRGGEFTISHMICDMDEIAVMNEANVTIDEINGRVGEFNCTADAQLIIDSLNSSDHTKFLISYGAAVTLNGRNIENGYVNGESHKGESKPEPLFNHKVNNAHGKFQHLDLDDFILTDQY